MALLYSKPFSVFALFVGQGPKSLKWPTRPCLSWLLAPLSSHCPLSLHSTSLPWKHHHLPHRRNFAYCFLSLNCSSSGLYLVNAQLSFSSFSDFFYLNHHFLRETYLFLSHFVEFTILITLLFYFFGYSLINLPFFH